MQCLKLHFCRTYYLFSCSLETICLVLYIQSRFSQRDAIVVYSYTTKTGIILSLLSVHTYSKSVSESLNVNVLVDITVTLRLVLCYEHAMNNRIVHRGHLCVVSWYHNRGYPSDSPTNHLTAYPPTHNGRLWIYGY